jgi:cobalt-zinc-cadmium efflux system outer membrane protein
LYELELTKSHFEHEKLKHEKLTEAFQSFVEILHLQEIKVLQNNRIFSVLELLNAVSKKVEAGKLSPAEKSRVKIRHFNEQMKLRVTDKSLKTAWLSITTMWGDEKSSFDFAEGDLRKLSMLPLSYSFKNSPLIQFAELSVEIQQNKIKSEKAIAIPNFSLGAGLKQSDIPGNTFQIGLSVPLPIFNRNQGNIKSAVYELEKAELELKATESELKSKIINIQSELELLFSETITLKDDIIPESLNAYTIITDGYLNGRFTYLDVVDAQKMWFQSREQYLNVLTEYHQKFFELDYLTGNKMHKNFKENN